MKMSVLLRKNLIIVVSSLCAVALTTALYSGWNLRRHLTNEYVSKGTAVAESIANSGVETMLHRDASTLQAIVDQWKEISGVAYIMVANSEREVISHTFVPGVPEEVLFVKTSARETTINNVHIKGKGDFIDIAAPILAGTIGIVHVGMDVGIIDRNIRAAILGQVSLIALILAAVLVMTYLFFEKHINSPLKKLTNYANQMLAHNYSATAGIESDDEFRYLARAIEKISAHFQQVIIKSEEFVKELSETAAELETANAQLKELDTMKTNFTSTVSHELRTPLTSVLGFAKLIKDRLVERIFPLVRVEDKKTEKTMKQISDNIDIIISEGERLTALINDVLDIAKMEAGKIEWKMDIFTARDLIDRSTAATSSLFERKGLTLVKEFDEDLPLITGDKDRLIQVAINLLSNAIKFTETGSVIFQAQRTPDEVVFSVTDSGVGIAKDDLNKVFEKFRQVGDVLTGKANGTGLGLPICKEIVLHHGGRIWVESKPGRGSTFFFSIPTDVQPVPADKGDLIALADQLRERVLTAMPTPQRGGRKTILVVDDDNNIRTLLRQALEAEGHRVLEAANGLEAIRTAKNEQPDLITLDIMMPEINGFDTAVVLKNDPLTMKIPIIVLSIVEDKERGYRLGVDRYLSKPIDIHALLGEIETLLSRGTSPKRFLVVDDDESATKTIVEILETKGYSAIEACSGSECIEKAASLRPDMIILDKMITNRHEIINTLRFEKGMENVLFILLGK
jgi:signal transduction histidine kinase/CheY-like chemotaxis protein